MNKIIESSIDYKGRKIVLKTGELAPQANMSVLAQMGETTVLATVVSKASVEDPGFLPLTVDYEEKLYAGGLIKSAKWIKREGRPSDDNIVFGRLIDHAVRPLFPKDFRDQVQLVVTVLSVDGENNPHVISLIAASAALTASTIPFNGPVASLEIGYINNEFVANPLLSQHKDSKLELMISYLQGEKVQAMEASIDLLTDEQIKEAIKFGYKEVEPIFGLINDFASKVGNAKATYVSYSSSAEVYKEVSDMFEQKMHDVIYSPKNKMEYWSAIDAIKKEATTHFVTKYGEEAPLTEVEVALDKLQAKYIRKLALEDKKRIDGRSLDRVRQITSQVSYLPRVHGSALFARELTQVLSITTLGSPANTLLTETLYGESESRYFHHYVGLGFSTGELSRIGNPGRREIGHGMLAQKALLPVLPSLDEFPYVIRVVSEVLSQNGSSSMASACGSSLSLMDAGVPIKAPVGGISIGLITDDNKKDFEVLTDIQGAEDFSGFMDFKMTGTQDAVTAIQMDIKLDGIPLSLFDKIIDASKKGRLQVLAEMSKTISTSNKELKDNAPRIEKVIIQKDQIGLVIGSGGKTIKEIQEKSGASLDIIEEAERGIVVVMATDKASLDKAVSMVELLIKVPALGEVYTGKVTKILDFGALVEFLPGKEGLLHVSEMSSEYVSSVRDFLTEGQEVTVKIKEIDEFKGRYSLTLKI